MSARLDVLVDTRKLRVDAAQRELAEAQARVAAVQAQRDALQRQLDACRRARREMQAALLHEAGGPAQILAQRERRVAWFAEQTQQLEQRLIQAERALHNAQEAAAVLRDAWRRAQARLDALLQLRSEQAHAQLQRRLADEERRLEELTLPRARAGAWP